MPERPRRAARAQQLLKIYLIHQQLRKRRLQRRLSLASHVLHAHTRLKQRTRDLILEPLPKLSSLPRVKDSNSSSDDSTSSSSASWLEETSSDSDSDSDSDLDSDSDSHQSGDEDDLDQSGYSGEDEGETSSSDDSSDGGESAWDGEDERYETLGESERPSLARRVQKTIQGMYTQRYEVPRDQLPRGPSYLHHVLTVQKNLRPDHFRQALRVSPAAFDQIVYKISDDPVFFNRSDQQQLPVEEQLAVTLYRFGHNGNAASLQSVANWAGLGKGTVSLVTCRVMAAILRPSFMHDAVRMPSGPEKEEAKAWVEAHSCHAWRGGWCLVDGTLVPLAERPYWFGESYFDRKSNYSLNVQVSVMPICLLAKTLCT
jgi:hypothetical protein